MVEMAKLLLIENLAVFLCAAAGFAYGAFRWLRPRQPLYASMIVLGLGCVMLGHLFQCIWLWTGAGLTDRFQIGVLGVAGAFSFFFSANFGQIDSLVDDGGKRFRAFRAAHGQGRAAALAFAREGAYIAGYDLAKKAEYPDYEFGNTEELLSLKEEVGRLVKIALRRVYQQ